MSFLEIESIEIIVADNSWYGLLIYIIETVFLLVATYMDIKWQEVYDWVWLAMIIPAMVLHTLNGPPSPAVLLSCGIYFAIQQICMGRAYGRADSHAFCCIALLWASFGAQLEAYIIHMGITFTLLIVIQLVKRNIGRNGKLKKPIPMIPYIAGGFLIESLCYIK